MLAWRMRCPHSGDRVDFKVNMGSGVLFCSMYKTELPKSARARRGARAREEFSVVHNVNLVMLAWKLK